MEHVREQLLVLLKKKDKDPVHVTHTTAILMLLGKGTANTVPDLENGESEYKIYEISFPDTFDEQW